MLNNQKAFPIQTVHMFCLSCNKPSPSVTFSNYNYLNLLVKVIWYSGAMEKIDGHSIFMKRVLGKNEWNYW